MKEITFSNKYLKFEIPEGGFKEGQKILFMGHLKGMTGGYEFDEEFNDFVFRPKEGNIKVDVFRNNLEFFKAIIKAKAHLYVLSNSGTIKHFWSLMKNEMYRFFESEFPTKEAYITYIKKYGIMYEIRMHGDYNANTFEAYTGLNMNKVKKQKDMKFDYIIQNPPYDDTLHLDFIDKGLDLLKDGGMMEVINPSTWVINVRDNKKADNLKKRLENGEFQVVKQDIENLNRDFGVVQSMPFTITTIVKTKEKVDHIDFTCCGDKSRKPKSLYDCNLIGEHSILRGILEKIQAKGDVLKNHITKKNLGKDYWYCKCVGVGKDSLISGSGAALCSAITDRVGMNYDSEVMWVKTKNGQFLLPYTSICYHYYKNEIKNEPNMSYDRGKKLTNNPAWNVCGTKEELENWKYFVFNNKLPLFINILLTFNQHNNSAGYLPWLVDKQYTDEEINGLFGFTDEEIKLINRTIEKYERNSPWFKRYMCGPDSVSDEEVQNFIDKLNEKYA